MSKYIDEYITKLSRTKCNISHDDYVANDNFTNEEFCNRLDKIKKWQYILSLLKNKPLIKQRTPEWYNLRKSRLTASDIYDACAMNKSLIKKKALNITFDISNVPAIEWGVLFESVALKIYSLSRSKVKIHEFGLIPDPNIECFGASPDGITDLGIMVEIKCPYSRKIIDGVIPPKYYAQMMGQLAACSLEECDYAEFNFKQLSQDEYLSIDNKDHPYNGMIVVYEDKVLYSKLFTTPAVTYKKLFDIDAKKIIYWRLEEMCVQKVYFNEDDWKTNYVPKIYYFWEAVLNYTPPPELTYEFIDDA